MLGVLDWGVGGLFAVRRARQLQPSTDLVYLSDAGNAPYGTQSRAQLACSVQRAVSFLVDQGAERVLVACHSGSTALRDIRSSVPVYGVIAPETVPEGRLGLIGGRRTIRSGAWRRALARPVLQRVAQPLSAHVEAATTSSPACQAALDRILRPLAGVDVLVLACTHYAALADDIRRRCPGATLVDPALERVSSLELAPGRARLVVWTTGDVGAMARAAQRAVGILVEPRSVG